MSSRSPNNALRYLGIGLQLSTTIIVGFFAGYFLDRKFGTMPWCTLGGVFLSLTAAFYNLYRELKDIDHEDLRQ